VISHSTVTAWPSKPIGTAVRTRAIISLIIAVYQ
jgi:hypothetical protein